MQIKKYLTKVTEEQQTKIRTAAEEIEVTQPEIVRAALDKFFANDWKGVKREIVESKVRAEAAEIERRIELLRKQKAEVEARIEELVN